MLGASFIFFEGTLIFFESQRLLGKLLLISHNHVSIAVLIASVVLPFQSPSLATIRAIIHRMQKFFSFLASAFGARPLPLSSVFRC